ncbi:MAG TPA: 30S ribosomal protein S2, partial [Coriobacteriia bacterium]|nr:30S ribosomal protein S2 [Coriobacteriia bacterium]
LLPERSATYPLARPHAPGEADAAYVSVRAVGARGGSGLRVGAKKQARASIRREAGRAGMPCVNQRWLGGMLTNFVTIRGRIKRMLELENMEESGAMLQLPKKEALLLRRELEKLQRDLNGIRDMADIPKAVFVVDTKREAIAVREARRLGIPLIGLVDTNADPDEVDYVIPGNDDAIRSVALICRVIADAALDGRRAAGLVTPGEGAPAAEEAEVAASDASATAPAAEDAEPAATEPAAEPAPDTAAPAE